jgi:ribonuclease P protein component
VATFYENEYNSDVKHVLKMSKAQRLVKNREFRAVLAERHRCSDHLLVVHMAANGVGQTRLGVSVGRAQGNAVARNRIKRVIREVFRLHQHEMPCGFDIVVTMTRHRRQGDKKGAILQLARASSRDAICDSLLKLVDLCRKKMSDS